MLCDSFKGTITRLNDRDLTLGQYGPVRLGSALPEDVYTIYTPKARWACVQNNWIGGGSR